MKEGQLEENGKILKLLEEGVAEGVFPGAVLLVAQAGQVVFLHAAGYRRLIPAKTPMGTKTIFDLASLTKPLATTLAVMKLVDDGRLGLDDPLGVVLKGESLGEKAGLTCRLLLCHAAGLPDWNPLYLRLVDHPPTQRKRVVRAWIIEEPFAYSPGEGTLYSDLGFMILEWVIEEMAGKRLAEYVGETFYRPLGLKRTFFSKNPPRPPFAKGGDERTGGREALDSHFRRNNDDGGLGDPSFGKGFRVEEFAATEECPWRKKVIQGDVGDENAYALGGYSGHAGLFSTAEEVHVIVNLLREHYLGKRSDFLRPGTVREFFRRQGIVEASDWALGWDTRALQGSSAGRHFSRGSVGHTGFTGTSIWMDLEKDVVAVLLTNRVHPTRNNDRIKVFRPRIHDTIMEALGWGSA